VDLNSEYGQEVLTLVDHYVSTNLISRSHISPQNYLHLEKYIKLLEGQVSCVVEEIKLKIGSKPGKHAAKSVLFKINIKGNTENLRIRRSNKYGLPNT